MRHNAIHPSAPPASSAAIFLMDAENFIDDRQIEIDQAVLIAQVQAEVAKLQLEAAYPPFVHWATMLRILDPTLRSGCSPFEILVETIIRHELAQRRATAVIDRVLPWLCATRPIFSALTEASAIHDVETLDGQALAWMATPRDVSPDGLEAFALISRLAHHLDGRLVQVGGVATEFGVTGIRTDTISGQEQVVCVAFACTPLG